MKDVFIHVGRFSYQTSTLFLTHLGFNWVKRFEKFVLIDKIQLEHYTIE